MSDDLQGPAWVRREHPLLWLLPGGEGGFPHTRRQDADSLAEACCSCHSYSGGGLWVV